ncbi:MAG: DUF3108 domain-containing protein [Calditrichia bacterium]
MFRKILITVLLVSFVTAAFALKKVDYVPAEVYHKGEELVYKVKWTFIRVGTLRLINEGLVRYKGNQYYKLKIYIDSADGIPFVTIHDEYESLVDSNSVPVVFHARENKGDYVLKTDYTFDRNKKEILVEVSKDYPDRIIITQHETVPMDTTYRDVLSLLYYARQMSGEHEQNIAIPTFVLTGRDSCYFHQVGEVQQVDFGGKDAESYYVEGKVKFIGIAGIKDDFEGWFSVDSQRVPLKAKMKAFFGSVTIELEDSQNWIANNHSH